MSTENCKRVIPVEKQRSSEKSDDLLLNVFVGFHERCELIDSRHWLNTVGPVGPVEGSIAGQHVPITQTAVNTTLA